MGEQNISVFDGDANAQLQTDCCINYEYESLRSSCMLVAKA